MKPESKNKYICIVRANRCTVVVNMTSCNFNECGQDPYWHDW